MTETNFEPYRKWLGIPTAELPANHYRLLGIDLFEDDPDVIENAAMRQISHVRTFQVGPHSDHSQRILNELATARICLLNSQKKSAYDESLRKQLAGPAVLTNQVVNETRRTVAASFAPVSLVSAPPPIYIPPAVVTRPPVVAVPPVGSATPSFEIKPVNDQRVPRRMVRKPMTTVQMLAYIVAGSMAVVVVFALIVVGAKQFATPTAASDASSKQKEKLAMSASVPAVAIASKSPKRTETSSTSSADVESEPTTRTATPFPVGRKTRFAPTPTRKPIVEPASEKLSVARKALEHRDLDLAKNELVVLDDRSGLEPAQAAELARLHDMLAHHRQFWNAVRDAIHTKLKPGDRFEHLKGNYELLAREGEEVKYKRNNEKVKSTISELPTRDAIAFAHQSMDHADSGGYLAVASFLWFDGFERRPAIRSRVVGLWRKAADASVVKNPRADESLATEIGLKLPERSQSADQSTPAGDSDD